MLRHIRLTTLVALFVVIPAVAVAAAPYAYVSNSGSYNVSVIDLGATPNTVSAVALPGSITPWGVALNAAGTRLYVTNLGNGSIYAVDTTTNPPSAMPPIIVPKQPVAVAVNPAGTRVYVSHMVRTGSLTGGAVTVIDTGTNAVMATANVGMLNEGIVVHPDGSRVYLASSRSNQVLVLEAAALENGVANVLNTIAVGTSPYGLTLNKAGTRLFVTNKDSSSVSAVDLTNGAIAEAFVGLGPIGIALSPDETRLYVANNVGGSISVLNAATLTALTPDIIVGGAPYGVDVAGDGRAFVANSAANSTNLWIVDPATFAVTSLTVGISPVAFGTFIYRAAFVETALRLSVSPESVVFGSAGPLTLTATLTRKDNGAPVSGGTVTFMIDAAAAGTAMTGSAGTATLTYTTSSLDAGAHTARASFSESVLNGATHRASEASAAFKVVYQFRWLSSGGTANAGSSIPIRWSATDANGNPIPTAQFNITSAACTSASAVAEPGAKVQVKYAGNSELRYDASTGQYTFNWKTDKAWAGSCRQLFVDSDDGASHSLTFQLH